MPKHARVAETISRYRLLTKLGAGGMGEVYRARDDHLNRDVAIKVLPRESQNDDRTIARFFREARAASALNHPNIVTVYDAGRVKSGHFIVMEFVQGRTIRAFIGQPLDTDKLREWGAQMAKALAAAHHSGIVHRDIKPENVMLRDDGYVKVLDFGLARLKSHVDKGSGAQTSIGTVTRRIFGTLRYLSPERAAGDVADTPTDVFSLGVVFYELITGRHPFDANTEYGVVLSILDHQPVPPRRLNPEVPLDLESLILSMLEKDPAQRPSAAEVATALTAPSPRPAVTIPGSTNVEGRFTVGRSFERAELRAALAEAAAGRGLMLCVSGEPGIGKSTLVEDFLSDLDQSGVAVRVARGRCSERLAGTEAYLPFLDALDSLIRGEDGPAIARLLKSVAPLWHLQLLPLSYTDSSASRLMKGARSANSDRMKRELMAFVEEAVRTRPLVMFFDDLHWVDVATVDLLNYMASRFSSMGLLIVVTYRPEELLREKHPFLRLKQDLQGRGACRELPLDFLSTDEVEAYLRLSFPGHRFPHEFAEQIHDKTEGNPLFMVEVLRYLRDRRAVEKENGQWVLRQAASEIVRVLPESVRGMVQRKIDLLEESDRRLLVAASVQGYEFDAAVVARALGEAPADVEDRLDRLDKVHAFGRRLREQEFPDRTLTLRYRFVHVLYQNMLYASITPARRASLSLAIARSLEELYANKTTEVATTLAVLYETAREFSTAADYFAAAAKRARDLFAYDEAVVLGRRALATLRKTADAPERRRRELAILMIMGVAASHGRGYSSSEAEEIYDQASPLCLEFGETAHLIRVLYGMVTFSVVRLQLDRAQQVADRLKHLADELQEPELFVQVTAATGLLHYYRGEFKAAVKLFERVSTLCDLDMRRSICHSFDHDPKSAAHIYLAWLQWCLGYPAAAVREIDAAMETARELAHHYMLATVLNFACGVHVWRGDWDALRAANEQMTAVANEGGYTYFIASSAFHDGLWQAKTGRRQVGLARMKEGLDGFVSIGGRTSIRRFLGEYVHELALDGKYEAGIDMVRRELEETGPDRFWQAELLRTLGELLLIGDPRANGGAAEDCFLRAIEVAKEQEAKSFELRAATSLGRLWGSRGDWRRAAALVAETYAWFTEGFDTTDLKEAQVICAAGKVKRVKK